MATFFRTSLRLQTKDRRTQKTEQILSLIHRIKLRLEGYFIWSASTSRTIYRTDSGLEHLIASMQSKKHSEDYSKHSMDSEDGQLAPEALEALDYADKSPGTLEVPDGRLQKRSMPA